MKGSRLNTAMLGAVVAACPFIDAAAVRDTIRATFQRKYPQPKLSMPTSGTFERARHEISFTRRGLISKEHATGVVPNAWPLQQPSATWKRPLAARYSTRGTPWLKDLTCISSGLYPSSSRRDACVDCGLCDLVCPDFCLVWEEEPHEVWPIVHPSSWHRLPLLQGLPEVRRRLPRRSPSTEGAGAGGLRRRTHCAPLPLARRGCPCYESGCKAHAGESGEQAKWL